MPSKTMIAENPRQNRRTFPHMRLPYREFRAAEVLALGKVRF